MRNFKKSMAKTTFVWQVGGKLKCAECIKKVPKRGEWRVGKCEDPAHGVRKHRIARTG